MKLYWGDIHNHCAVSYGQGSPGLALDNARRHLDFCSITGHAFWPDMPMEKDFAAHGGPIGTHLGGFAKLQYFWKSLMRDLRAANRPGTFVTLPSYEWHSLLCGDYNCYAPDFDLALIDAPDVKALARRIQRSRRDFILLPHHCGYVRGCRGLNWNFFDERVSPLAEIYSNHGCGEADDAPFPYYHSMGPRSGESMLRDGLAAGRRFGFYAGTDSHDGYPGHYGHGRIGVWAAHLKSEEIWRGLRERRTIASTGVNMAVEVDAGDAGIGGVTAAAGRRDLRIRIEGDAPIDAIDFIEGGAGKWRVRRLNVPMIEPRFSPGRFKIKIEVGWGVEGHLAAWSVRGRLLHGSIRGVTGYFRHSAWDLASQTSSERLRRLSANVFDWRCHSISNPYGAMGGTHFNAGGTQAVVLDLIADRNSRLQVAVHGMDFDLPLKDLARRSVARPLAGSGSPAIKIHRAIPEREFSTSVVVPDYAAFTAERAFAYLRIRQTDGHTVWASPVWFE